MSSKKRVAAVVITIAALTVGSTGFASAHGGFGKSGFKTTESKAAHQAHRAAQEALVASTIGIDAVTIRARINAGETLAAIAGVKKDALITALVAFETAAIDARVTAGTMTAAQAAAKKADLTAHVTAKINDVRGPGMGKHGKGKGKGPRN